MLSGLFSETYNRLMSGKLIMQNSPAHRSRIPMHCVGSSEMEWDGGRVGFRKKIQELTKARRRALMRLSRRLFSAHSLYALAAAAISRGNWLAVAVPRITFPMFRASWETCARSSSLSSRGILSYWTTRAKIEVSAGERLTMFLLYQYSRFLAEGASKT